jgi:hypothetical protein
MWAQVKQALSQSTARFLTKLASLVPGLVALILALVISVALGVILAIFLRWLLKSLDFDGRMVRWGFSSGVETPQMKSPTLIVSRAIALLVVLVGVLIGIAALDAQWTSLLAQTIIAYIPNILGAAFVLLIGSIVAGFLERTVLIGAVNLNLHYARLLSEGVKWLVLVLAVAMALEHLRIAPNIVELAFGILFGGIVLALALAVGLGSKDLVTKSLERDSKKVSSEQMDDPLRHL